MLHHHDCPSVVLNYMNVTLSSMTPGSDQHNFGDISSGINKYQIHTTSWNYNTKPWQWKLTTVPLKCNVALACASWFARNRVVAMATISLASIHPVSCRMKTCKWSKVSRPSTLSTCANECDVVLEPYRILLSYN